MTTMFPPVQAPRARNTRTRRTARLGATLAAAVLTPAAALDAADTVRFTSPAGVTEQCRPLPHMPGANYTAADVATEARYCAIDFYDGEHALCPKVFSTSPGTLVYDISRGLFAGRAAAFEDAQCAHGSPHKDGAVGEPVMYKMTMNDRQTSATFSAASLLYYHFARYLDSAVHVPVSVYRSMDRQAHRARVAERGAALSAQRKGGAMNHAGWETMLGAEREPSSYGAVDELFTADRAQVFGVLLQPHGDRYGPEVNGTRRSGWGEGQSRDFQQTAPFSALRSPRPLREAIEEGVQAAAADPTLRQAMRHGIAPEQMVFWMRELSEIALLDFVFSQQDRIGNIDYLTFWYWVEDGQVRHVPASSSQVPEELAAHFPIRIRRTQLNDNDAGGHLRYANFTKKTGMLEKLRHFAASTYRRLLALDEDFARQGPLHAYVGTQFGLNQAQFGQVVANTKAAAAILRASCGRGELHFDLEPATFLLDDDVTPETLDCERP
jgi:hypothetical protein